MKAEVATHFSENQRAFGHASPPTTTLQEVMSNMDLPEDEDLMLLFRSPVRLLEREEGAVLHSRMLLSLNSVSLPRCFPEARPASGQPDH